MSLQAEVLVSITAGLEKAINTYLSMDPDALAALGQLESKVVAVDVEGTGIRVFCLPHRSGITLLSQYMGEPNTTITGRPIALLKLMTQDSSEVMFGGEVRISGDVETGQRFKRILDKMDIDWEEHLSRLTGDTVAHQTGHLLREINQWWQNSREQLAANSREYLQDEIQINPTREEIEQFYSQIEKLRDDVARLTVRLAQLEKNS